MSATAEAKNFFDFLNKETCIKIGTEIRALPEKVIGKRKEVGFTIKNEIINPRKIKLRDWLNGRRRFRQDILSEFGAEPLAIVYPQSWNFICKELGLFRLRFNNNGGVIADIPELKNVKYQSQILNEVSFLFVFVSFFVGAIISLLVSIVTETKDPVPLFGIFIPTAIVIGIYLTIRNILINRKKLSLPNGELHILFPDMQSPNSGRAIAIDFVEPPKNLHPLLLKINSKRRREEYIEVVAHPDAFTVNPDEEILAWADPIITIVREKHVAILAQFGEFPNEKKALQAIENVELLPFS